MTVSIQSCQPYDLFRSGRSVRFWLLLTLVSLIATAHVQAQDWRLSAGYAVEHFDLQYLPHPQYEGTTSYTQKGGLELELERYLLYRLYIALSANVLLHNQETVFLGGPLDFKQAGVGASAGLQWARFGIYGGVQAGRMWDLRFRAHRDGTEVSVDPRPAGTGSTWTTAFRGGFKYYLLRHVRLHAELLHRHHMPGAMVPAPGGTTTPEVRWAGFSPLSFRIGISISIPWSSSRRVDRISRQGRLPVLMEVAGVSFRSPLESTSVTSGFGRRWGREHQGLDLQADRGDRVLAAASGVVIEAGTASGYGQTVMIHHANNYTTRYAHLSRIRVREGQSVRGGDVIGTAGSSGSATGVHLHFELLRNGLQVDPRNYIRF